MLKRLYYRLRGDHKDKVANIADIDTIHDDDTVSILYKDGGDGPCLVSYTGVGHAMGGVDYQTPEFKKTGLAGPQIYVIDKNRSWGNALDLDLIAEKITKLAGGREIYGLGNSMGGFLAILLSGPLCARRVLAFTPQWSVDARIVPEESRWMPYRRNIAEYRFPDLTGAFVPQTEYYLIFGDSRMETYHADFFPQGENIHRYVVTGAGHKVAAYLKEKDCLYPAIDACLFREDVEAIFAGKGVETR